MYFVRAFILSLHIFGVIFWMGGLLMITSLLARVPEEVGLPKERFLGAARGLFESTVNLGAAVSIILGLVLILMDPSVLRQGWLHAKLLLVAILLFYHVRFYRRIKFLEEQSEPVIEPRVSRHPRDGERAVDRDPVARRDETLLAVRVSDPISLPVPSPVIGRGLG